MAGYTGVCIVMGNGSVCVLTPIWEINMFLFKTYTHTQVSISLKFYDDLQKHGAEGVSYLDCSLRTHLHKFAETRSRRDELFRLLP